MNMGSTREVVITGVGVVSPIGVGATSFWDGLCRAQSAVRRLVSFDGDGPAPPLGAAVLDFDPLPYIRPRKALKVMSRDIQLGFVAAELACREAGLEGAGLDPERLGVAFGADMIAADLDEMIAAYRASMSGGRFEFAQWGRRAMGELFPLWMLKYLPNMPACHVAIARDARGPNNTHTMAEVSSLSAVIEAVRILQRGQADAMIAGGVSARNHPVVWARRRAYPLSHRVDDPASACRPFDAERDGIVFGEGAGAFLLETRRHAEARGAAILARVVGVASTFEAQRNGSPLQGAAIRAALRGALADAGLRPDEVGHVNADGLSTVWEDQIEAQAIGEVLGDVPVTAPKSYFGNLSAGAGVVEMAASVLALQKGLIPPTVNYCRPDPACPVNVVHGALAPLGPPVALVVNHSRSGRSVAVVLAS